MGGEHHSGGYGKAGLEGGAQHLRHVSGQLELEEEPGRLLLCTLVTVAGYYMAYHHTALYQGAKEWVKSRYSVFKIGKRL